jgi:hypothetical protein
VLLPAGEASSAGRKKYCEKKAEKMGGMGGKKYCSGNEKKC